MLSCNSLHHQHAAKACAMRSCSSGQKVRESCRATVLRRIKPILLRCP